MDPRGGETVSDEKPRWSSHVDVQPPVFSLELFERGIQAIRDRKPEPPVAITTPRGYFLDGDYGVWVAEMHRLGRTIDPQNPRRWTAA